MHYTLCPPISIGTDNPFIKDKVKISVFSGQ